MGKSRPGSSPSVRFLADTVLRSLFEDNLKGHEMDEATRALSVIREENNINNNNV